MIRPSAWHSRGGFLSPVAWLALVSCAAIALLACLAIGQRPDARRSGSGGNALRVYCAAGVSAPIIQALSDYQQRSGQPALVTRMDGSGRLYGQIVAEAELEVNDRADLFVSADAALLAAGRARNIIGDRFALAIEHPVIAAATDSDWSVSDLNQLIRSDQDRRWGIADENAAIGQVTRQIAKRGGVLPELLRHRKLEAENVMQLAQALVTRSLDAAVVWDTTVAQVNRQQGYPVLRIVAPAEGPVEDPLVGHIAVGVVRGTRNYDAALRLARFLGDPDGGLKRLAEAGFEIVEDEATEQHREP